MFLSWHEDYNTGNEEVDAQHRQLAAIINELHDVRHTKASQDVVGVILSKLIDYMDHHFDFEENALEQMNYPELEKHKEDHNKLRKAIERIQIKYLNKGPYFVEDVLLTVLKEWFENHVVNEDKEAFSFNG